MWRHRHATNYLASTTKPQSMWDAIEASDSYVIAGVCRLSPSGQAGLDKRPEDRELTRRAQRSPRPAGFFLPPQTAGKSKNYPRKSAKSAVKLFLGCGEAALGK